MTLCRYYDARRYFVGGNDILLLSYSLYPSLSRNRTEYLETGQEVKIFKLDPEIKILLLNLIRDATSITKKKISM